jgi:hypothetical protein
VETADGECFRLGFRNLSGGRAMLEHVRQGGKPYDIRGCHLTEMVSEIATLSRFNRASAGRVLEGVTQEVVSQAQVYYKQLRENLKRMSTSRGYTKYFESWHPADITEQEELVENIKTLFVEQTIDTRIEQALPLLAKIQQGRDMKEAEIFESWINNLAEGTWNLPETPEQLDKLKTLMTSELIVGPDATNATEQLYDLVGDDILFDRLSELAAQDPRANAWNDTEVMNRLAELGIQMPEPTEPGNPAEPQTAPEPQGVAEGYQLDEGAIETITALAKKIPGIGKYYQMAQQYKPQLIEILKTSKSGKEVKQKMEQLAAGQSATVAESGMMKQLGGLAVGGGSILSTMWMNAMGMIDGVLANAAAGEVGGAVASGSILGLIPVTLMLFAAMLLFKGSKQSSDEKAQAFQAQRGQQGVAEEQDSNEIGPGWKTEHGIVDRVEGNSVIVKTSQGKMGVNIRDIKTAEAPGQGMTESAELNTMLKYAGMPVAESRMIDESGETLMHVLDRFKHEVAQFEQGADLDDNLFDALYDYYVNKGEMPYGTAKARTGDPYEWVSDRLDQELGTGNHTMRAVPEADAISTFEVMSGFDAPVAEGACNMTAEGSYCPEHGLAECGGGMYESREGDAVLARIKSLALIR